MARHGFEVTSRYIPSLPGSVWVGDGVGSPPSPPRGGGSTTCLEGGVRVHRFNYGERGRGGLTSKRRGCSTLLCNKQESYLNILLLVQTETVLSLLILCVSWLCPQLNYLAEETSEGQEGKERLTGIYHQLVSRQLFIIIDFVHLKLWPLSPNATLSPIFNAPIDTILVDIFTQFCIDRILMQSHPFLPLEDHCATF